MAHWLFKQEPSDYSYYQLEKDGKTTWDGVANNLALKHLRKVEKGDKIVFYHTGKEKQAVGIMEAVSNSYADPSDKSLVVVDVRPLRRSNRPVTLALIKSDPQFADWELVRISRLSIMPVPQKLWDRIMELSG